MSIEHLAAAAVAVLLMGALVGYLLRLTTHHCAVPTLAEQESAAVAAFKASLHALKGKPHTHVFPASPARSKSGWQVWECQACGQEYTSRAQRIKPEAGIV